MKKNNDFYIKKFHKNIFILFIFVVLIVPSVMFGADGKLSVVGTMARPKAAEVDNMTLIIGNHMVALNSLSSELNEIIQKSVENSNQNKIYYKSELTDNNREGNGNNGVWYECEQASDIYDISDGNTSVVSYEFIDELDILYYTDKEGRTFDLTSGNEIDIFDIENVYDISNMVELKNIKLEYESKKDQQPKDISDKQEAQSLTNIKNSLKSVLELDVKDKSTDDLDQTLGYLKKYNDYLIQNDEDDNMKNKLVEIRNAFNAQRKEIVVNKVIDKLDEEMKNVSELSDSYSEAENNLIESQSSLASLISILNDNDGDTLLQKKQTQLIKQLLIFIKDNDFKQADSVLKKLIALDNILLRIIEDKSIEKDLVDELVLVAKKEYYNLIRSGESEEYKQAKVLNRSSAILDNLKNKYKNDIKRKSDDFNIVNKMQLQLLDTLLDKQNLLKSNIDTLIQEISSLKEQVNVDLDDDLIVSDRDEFKVIALNDLQTKFNDFESQLEDVENLLNDNDDQFKEKLNSLTDEYRKALDKNDLLTAKNIKNEINELQKSKQNNNQNDLVNLKIQLSDIQNQLDKTTLGVSQRADLESKKSFIQTEINKILTAQSQQAKSASKIVKEASEKAKTSLSQIPMRDEDVTNLTDSISVIKEIANNQVQVAYPAMVDIEDTIKLKVAGDESVPASLLDVADDVGKAVIDYKDSFNSQVSDDISEMSLDEKISQFASDNNLDEITKNLLALGALDELLGQLGDISENSSFEDLNNSQKVLKLKIDKLLSELNNLSTKKDNLSQELTFKQQDFNVELINKKYFNSELYASAETIADILNMQYIWDGNLVRGWLVGNGKKYSFSQGKNVVIVSKDYKLMSNAAVFETNKHDLEGVLWLPNDFLLNEFKIVVQSIRTTNKSLVYDENTYEKMKKMYDAIK